MMYTAITGEKDLPRNDIKAFSAYERFKEPRLNAKIYKILPHLFMDCEYSVWFDGNMFPKKAEEEYIKLLNGNDIAVMVHPERKCIYEEADFCIKKGKDTPENILPQIERYKLQGYPKNKGMAACGFIVRHHTPKMKALCEKWWAEICAGSSRDQLSFPYVFREGVTYIPYNCWDNELFEYKTHNHGK